MKHRHQLSMAQAPVPPYRLPVWANTGTTHQQLVAQPFSCEPKTTRGNPCSCIIIINDPPYNYICNMQVRFHRNIAASSLAADCNVPQRPPAVIRSFTSIQIVHTHTDGHTGTLFRRHILVSILPVLSGLSVQLDVNVLFCTSERTQIWQALGNFDLSLASAYATSLVMAYMCISSKFKVKFSQSVCACCVLE